MFFGLCCGKKNLFLPAKLTARGQYLCVTKLTIPLAKYKYIKIFCAVKQHFLSFEYFSLKYSILMCNIKIEGQQ